MAERQGDGSIAPRRSLGGPILPPPPPEMAEKTRQAEEKKAAAERAAAERRAEKEARAAEKDAKRQAAAREREQARLRSEEAARQQQQAKAAANAREEQERRIQERAAREEAERSRRQDASAATTTVAPVRPPAPSPSSGAGRPASDRPSGKRPRRTRRAQLRLVQVDAWSVMKTAFLLSIALGIVLVVAVAIIWSVLGAAGVWDSINSIVQQAVGTDNGTRFDIQQYLGTSRVLGFTMIVAVLDVVLITAIATLGAFLYNLSAALLGGIEVTLAEDS